MVKTYSQLYLDTRMALMEGEEPQRAGMVARELLRKASGLSQEQLLARKDQPVPDDLCQTLRDLTARACKGEPLAYILEEWDFYGMTLYVSPHVLIPRDDTCALVELAVEAGLAMAQEPRVLDLCTGSGCIGLAIAHHIKDARVTLADLSREALAVAKKNVALQKLSGRVNCVQADALAQPPAFLGTFDMIASNPPYVTTGEMRTLEPSVRQYEPHLALEGGADGLDFYRAIVKHYGPLLRPEGVLAFEFGMGQGDAVCRILQEGGFRVLRRKTDYGEIERAVLARRIER